MGKKSLNQLMCIPIQLNVTFLSFVSFFQVLVFFVRSDNEYFQSINNNQTDMKRHLKKSRLTQTRKKLFYTVLLL